MYYKLHDWIDKNNIDISKLSYNIYGYEILEKHKDKILWYNILNLLTYESFQLFKNNIYIISEVKFYSKYISRNPFAVNYLDKNRHLINWYYLCLNPNPDIIKIINNTINDRKYFLKLYWNNLCLHNNDIVLDFVFKYPKRICWDSLSSNSNMKAVEMLLDNPDKINWFIFSKNSNVKAVEFMCLSKNLNKIDPFRISLNRNKKAMKFLSENIEMIDWINLSVNDSDEALELLNKNQDKINWCNLSTNPIIFKLDYERITQKFSKLNEEIIIEAMNPRRICKYLEIEGYDYLEEMYGY